MLTAPRHYRGIHYNGTQRTAFSPLCSSLETYALETGALEAYPMGMAVIDPAERTHIYNSDRPEEHLSEARAMYRIFQEYVHSGEGREFLSYLDSRNRKMMELKGVGAGDLGEGVVAAVLRNNLEGILLSNYQGKSFEQRVGEMARQYNMDHESMQEYVLAHETAHMAGYKSERDTEAVLQQYFSAKAAKASAASEPEKKAKYLALARIAQERKKGSKTAGKGTIK